MAPFVARARRDAPPETLADAELTDSIESLRRKLASARRSLLLAHAAGAALTVAVLGAGFAVMWAGPAPFFERFLGRDHVTTTFDAVAWWLILVLFAIVGGAFGDQLLRGKLRIARRRRHRVQALERRLDEAVTARRERGLT